MLFLQVDWNVDPPNLKDLRNIYLGVSWFFSSLQNFWLFLSPSDFDISVEIMRQAHIFHPLLYVRMTR